MKFEILYKYECKNGELLLAATPKKAEAPHPTDRVVDDSKASIKPILEKVADDKKQNEEEMDEEDDEEEEVNKTIKTCKKILIYFLL